MNREDAEPAEQQQPAAWGVFDGPNLHDMFFTEEEAQEMVRLKGDGSIVNPLFTSPPSSKTWVGLTLEESLEFLPSAWRKPPHKAPPGRAQAVQAIEAKLREKNHG